MGLELPVITLLFVWDGSQEETEIEIQKALKI